MSRREHVLAALASVTFVSATLLAGCSHHTNDSDGTFATVCGHVLSRSAAGAYVIATSEKKHVTVRDLSPGGVVFLRLSSNCQSGAHWYTRPADSAKLAVQVPAGNNESIAVGLYPKRRTFDVTVDRGSSAQVPETVVHIRLSRKTFETR